jgi:hypothetical protein
MLFSSAIRQVVLPVLVLAAVLLPGRVTAQTAPVEPYYVVTTRADVPLKSGDMDGYYPVASLAAGQVLWIDAEGAGWVRVAYPAGLSVYVRADEVREEPGGLVVVLTKVSALKSRNASAGFAQSWQRAIPHRDEPAIGTRLTVIEAITGPDGSTMGYAVAPPASVRGYVKANALRAATDAEVEAYLATVPETVTPVEVTDPTPPADDVTELEPAINPATDDPEPGTEQPGDGDNDGATDSLLDPMVPAGGDQGQPEEDPQPAADQPEGDDDGVTIIEQGEAQESRLVGTLTHLAELFTQVQKQDSNTAELDELAAEFRRAISAQGDDAIGQRIRAALGQRLQLVEMRITARDARRDLRRKRDAIDRTYASVAGRVRDLESSRGYQFVGRLVRSSVYDGQRLPLMFRIVSVNESIPRTIGYIVPGDDRLGIAGKLGEIVGVLGTSELDAALSLRIVTPTRVDVLTPEGIGLPESQPEPAAASADLPGS